MTTSNFPLATLSLSLVAAYAGLAGLGFAYWEYLKALNNSKPPPEMRWTLVLEAPGADFLHKLDLDKQPYLGGCSWGQSVRSQLEAALSSGDYLSHKHAAEELKRAPAVSNLKLPESESRCAHTVAEWDLAPLLEGVVLDESLRPQVEDVVEMLRGRHGDPEEAKAVIASLTFAVMALEPGESSASAITSARVLAFFNLCCNRVSEPNTRLDFTTHEYTKGESDGAGLISSVQKCFRSGKSIRRPGKSLSWKATSLTPFIGSLLLFATWAAFYPGIVITGSDHSSGDGALCTADRVMDDVNDLVHKAKRQVSYFTAARQLEDTLTHELQMQAAVVNYTCADDEGVEGPVPFPHWCAGRRQDELNRARVCCRDYQVTLADQCHYFGASGLGLSRYCFSEFPGWEPDVTVSGSGQAGCENHNSPCPASPEEEDEEQNSLAAYIADKAQRNDEGSGQAFPELPPEVSDPIAEMVSGMAKTIKARVDAASDYYIGYVIARMWFPAPLLLWNSPWHTAVRRSLFGLSKRAFVIVVIFLWFAVDFVVKFWDMWEGPSLTIYFKNIAADPCFLDGDFLKSRVAAIGTMCEELQNMSFQVYQANYSIANMYRDIVTYGEPLPGGCSCQYPGNRSTMERFVLDNSSGLRPFAGHLEFCADADAQKELLNPPQAEVNWYTVWFKSGVVAEILLKVTLVNLAYALVGYVDPLNTYGGWYEVHSGSKKLPLERQNLIASLLRSQFLRDTWLWGVVSGVLIFNLLWSGIAAFMPEEGLAEYCAQRQEEGAHHDKVAGIWFFVMSLLFVLIAVGGKFFLDKQTERLKPLDKRAPAPTRPTATRQLILSPLRTAATPHYWWLMVTGGKSWPEESPAQPPLTASRPQVGDYRTTPNLPKTRLRTRWMEWTQPHPVARAGRGDQAVEARGQRPTLRSKMEAERGRLRCVPFRLLASFSAQKNA